MVNNIFIYIMQRKRERERERETSKDVQHKANMEK